MTEDLNFLSLFRNESEVARLQAGAVLFQKGDPATTMYVVRSGELQIGDGNQVYEIVGAGGIIGEMAIVDGAPRSATVRAVVESEVIAIDARRFTSMVQHTPYFAVRVMRVMTRRLRAMNEYARTHA